MSTVKRPERRTGIFDQPYWEHVEAGELRVQECSECEALRYPPGPSCPHCLSADYRWKAMCGRGTLLSWTTFHRKYFPGIPVPYTVVSIVTEEGVLLIGNLANASPTELCHDMPMRAVIEETQFGEHLGKICNWEPYQA